MWIVLTISVGLNLLVAGVVASAAWHLHSRGGFGFQERLSSFLSTLPADRAESLSGILDRSRPELGPLRQEFRQARRDAVRLFAAEPFEKDAFATTNARLLEAEMKLRKGYIELMTELAENMTAQERQAFVEWREKHRRWLRRARP